MNTLSHCVFDSSSHDSFCVECGIPVSVWMLRYFIANSGVTSLSECKQLCVSHGSCVGIEYNEGASKSFVSPHRFYMVLLGWQFEVLL